MFNYPMSENNSHNHNSILEILFFTSPLCGPCPIMQKRLSKAINKKNLPIKVTKIDVLKSPEVAENYDVVACPTLIFPNFMTVCGCYETEILEELVSTYFASAFEFQRITQPTVDIK